MEHEHNTDRPVTAVEEAMLTLVKALEAGMIEQAQLPLLAFRRRWMLQGATKTLAMVLELLHTLHHRYNNDEGRLN